MTDLLYVAIDIDDQKPNDIPALVITRKFDDEHIEIVNALVGSKAIDIYSLLINKGGK